MIVLCSVYVLTCGIQEIGETNLPQADIVDVVF
jgi:hypothetical protein